MSAPLAARPSDAATPAPAAASDAGPSSGMLRSVRAYPAFRLMLIGTLATNSAFWMYQVAVGWLALELTDSPAFVGLAGFVGGIPLLLLALPAGVLIDRFDGRVVLLAGQAGVLLVAAVFAVLVGMGVVRPWVLLALVFAYGSAMSFVFPSRTTMVPSLVDRPDLTNAIALNSATQNATRVLGPSLAGVLIALVGVSGTFAVAAMLQVVALATTHRLPRGRPGGEGRSPMGWSAMTVGFRVVAASPFLTALILLALAPTVLVMPYLNLMPVFARDVLDLGSAGLGLLLAGVGLGTVGGALSVARWERLRSRRQPQVAMATAYALLVIAFAVTPVVAVDVALLFLAGWSSAAYFALNQTALQLNVDDEVRGRVFSVYLLTWGLLPLGQLPTGLVADAIGAPVSVAGASTLALIGIALIAWRFPSLRSASARAA